VCKWGGGGVATCRLALAAVLLLERVVDGTAKGGYGHVGRGTLDPSLDFAGVSRRLLGICLGVISDRLVPAIISTN